MHSVARIAACLAPLVVVVACSKSSGGDDTPAAPPRPANPATPSKIEHVVVVVQENHTFDNHFGQLLHGAAVLRAPPARRAPGCCEMPHPRPSRRAAAPVVLDDDANASYDPNHTQACELAGARQRQDGPLRHRRSVELLERPATSRSRRLSVVKPYHDYAAQYAIADHYFQSVAGQSSSNDMYLAVAKFVFLDNVVKPDATGQGVRSHRQDGALRRS
jgi:hypothetical protein